MKQTHTSANLHVNQTHVPKPAPQREHANETKFWLSLFIEKRDLYKYIETTSITLAHIMPTIKKHKYDQ